MHINVQWVNATRQGQERQAIEQSYHDRLLDLFGTVSNAAYQKGHWHRCAEPAVHPWVTYNNIAHIDATKDLIPTERKIAHFTVKFQE